MARKTLIAFRRDTAATWTAANPTLAAGEPGFETDTGKVKIGDGSTAWTSLAYVGASGSSPLTTKGDLFGHSTVDARIPVGSNGQVLTADSTQTLGLAWTTPGSGPGTEIGYDQITATVNVASTNEAAPTTIISCAAHTFDGSPVLLTVFFAYLSANASNQAIIPVLFESTTQITRLGDYSPVTSTATLSAVYQYRFTPSAGSHTYSIAAWATSLTGVPNIGAGSGSGANYPPSFARFTKA